MARPTHTQALTAVKKFLGRGVPYDLAEAWARFLSGTNPADGSDAPILVEPKTVKDSWVITHAPAVNVLATATKAAVAGKKNVLTSITGTLASIAVPTAVSVVLQIKDGSTVVWSARMSIQAVAGEMKSITLSGLHIEGTTNTGLTVDFSAAGGANVFESVSASGYTY